jgi:hypothetical protein
MVASLIILSCTVYRSCYGYFLQRTADLGSHVYSQHSVLGDGTRSLLSSHGQLRKVLDRLDKSTAGRIIYNETRWTGGVIVPW